MSYNIDPCHACWQKYKNEGVDINDLNNCFVDTTNAFSNTNETMSRKTWCDCMSKKMADLPYVAGKPRNFDNFQLNRAISWNQAPHHFPALLKTNTPDQALKICLTMCADENSIVNCKTDRSAVVFNPKPDPKPDPKPAPKPAPKLDNSLSSSDNDTTFQDEAKANPVSFWIAFIIVALILSGVLVVFFIALDSNRLGK